MAAPPEVAVRNGCVSVESYARPMLVSYSGRTLYNIFWVSTPGLMLKMTYKEPRGS